VSADAWVNADPTLCPICGKDSCVEHLPADHARADRLAAVVERERIKREAHRVVDQEERGRPAIPPFVSLRTRARIARPSVAYRIDHWQPEGARVMLAAQFKAGKTTLVDNLVRSLLDGDPFMGSRVSRLTGVLALVDFEMQESQLDTWLASQNIRNDDRVFPISLRGKASAFDILDPRVRADWALRFRQASTDYLMLDCVRPILDALGLDEQREAGRFLVALDALLAEAGIPEALVVQHMGHTGDRARGDSRLRDWPDVEWRMTRQDDDPSSPRFLSAYGRDVDVPESQLAYDAATRRLTLVGGSRADARMQGALDAVVEILTASADPLSGRGVKDALEDSEHSRDAIEKALKAGVRLKTLTVTPGKKNARLYQVSGSVPAVSVGHTDDHVSESVPPPYRRRTL
jgi:hypothetical protein